VTGLSPILSDLERELAVAAARCAVDLVGADVIATRGPIALRMPDDYWPNEYAVVFGPDYQHTRHRFVLGAYQEVWMDTALAGSGWDL